MPAPESNTNPALAQEMIDQVVSEAAKQPTDAFGKPIKMGCTVTYAVRRGSLMVLKQIKVTEVTVKNVRGFDPNDPTRRFRTLSNFQTLAVYEYPNAVRNPV